MAEENAPKRFTAEQARQKAAECRGLCARVKNPEHRVMLEHMADTWERIAGTLENDK